MYNKTLNLRGTILSGDKVPALVGNRVLFRCGAPVSTKVSVKFNYLTSPEPAETEQMHGMLVVSR